MWFINFRGNRVNCTVEFSGRSAIIHFLKGVEGVLIFFCLSENILRTSDGKLDPLIQKNYVVVVELVLRGNIRFASGTLEDY